MNNADRETTISWASGVNLVLGIWLFISPWAISYSMPNVLWNNVVVGAAIFVLSWIRLANRGQSGVASWINLLLGIWLIIAPFAMHYQTSGQVWNSVIIGIIVGVLAIASGSTGASRHPTATA